LDSYSGQDVFGVRTKKGLEPLCTLYSKNCISAIDNQMKIKDYGLHSLLKTIPSEFIEMENSNLLFNMNTQQDLEDLKDFSRFSEEPN
jgi:molybdopterin-guanine dinucleotide biosynthesis protein A